MWTKKLMLTSGLVLGLSACGIEASINNSLDNLEKETIDKAFESIKKVAEENGGAAIMVHAGQETTLEVTNAESDLFGAKVIIPAGALPADVKHAAATIQGGGETPAVQADDIKVTGPLALVAVVGLPLAAPVELLLPVTITLPYAKDSSYPTDQLVLGQIASEGTVVVKDSVPTESPDVTGASQDLQAAFSAVWPVDYNGEEVEAGIFAYKVVMNEEVICVGQQENVVATGSTFYDVGSKVSLLAGLGNSMELENTAAIAFDPSAASFPQSLPQSAFTVTCGGTSYTKGTGVTGFNFVSWNETSNSAGDCNGSGDCTEGLGTVVIAGQSTFTAESGETVKVGFNVTVSDFSWLY